MPAIPMVSKARAKMKGVSDDNEGGQGYTPEPTIGLNQNPLLRAIGNAKAIRSPWQGIIPLDGKED